MIKILKYNNQETLVNTSFLPFYKKSPQIYENRFRSKSQSYYYINPFMSQSPDFDKPNLGLLNNCPLRHKYIALISNPFYTRHTA